MSEPTGGSYSSDTSRQRHTVVCVDDERPILAALGRLLENEPYELITTDDPARVLDLVSERDVSLIIADQRMPGMTGIDLLDAVRTRSPCTARIILTGYASSDRLSGAVQTGWIEQVLHKPWDDEELKTLIRRALSWRDGAEGRVSPDVETSNGLAGCSEAIGEIRRMIRRVAAVDSTVLITGETGTGKELVAAAIHRQAPRRSNPFVGINCGAISETLLASELFGHVRGSFTGADHDKRGLFEAAGAGTIFLDEIGELPPALQSKLLRALETREILRVGSTRPVRIDARILAATNGDLGAMMQTGRFRTDLYYRLNVMEIRIPPLRERPEDIPLITEHLLHRLHRRMSRPVPTLTPDALKALVHYRWPGNTRELANVLERAMILSDSGRLESADLPFAVTHPRQTGPEDLKAARVEFERSHIARVLVKYGGDKRRAAKALGIDLSSLYRKLPSLPADPSVDCRTAN